MSQGTNARHRRHVERARQQGRADGPATVHKMHAVANAASIARVTAELTAHTHDDTCIVTGESGRRWCTESERYL